MLVCTGKATLFSPEPHDGLLASFVSKNSKEVRDKR